MMKALVDPRVYRVCQIEVDTETFDVAAPLQWVTIPAGLPVTTQWRFDGTSFVAPPEPPPPGPGTPRGLAFARLMHRNLAGADEAARWARGRVLRRKSWRVEALVQQLSWAGQETLSRIRLSLVQDAWAEIKADPVIGLAGSDPEHLTAAEAAAVEADAAANFGIQLA